ncbi:MAG TPA: hypothetical protein DF613_04205 [Lachnospiraceae bacterium]|nr:hypothetical protein [Lachnospiraceae bacterium]
MRMEERRMFCPNCGEKLPDGSKFCSACGANLSEFTEEFVNAAESGAPVMPAVPTKPDNTQAEYVQPKQKKNFKMVGGLAVVIVVVVIAVFVVRGLFSSGSGGDNAYAYMSGGKYELITNLKKDQTIEIASSRAEDAFLSLLAFDPGGKYIYYYTKYDSSMGTGSLCRAEYGKLRENSAKNDKYIEVIATNVRLGFRFLDDGTVVYQNGDDTLYSYDGKEAAQIAKGVRTYYTDGSDHVLYESGDDSEEYMLYGVSLSDRDNKVKLASGYSYIINASDFNNIFYIKSDDDYNESLYVVGLEKDSEKLGDNVHVFGVASDAVYFAAPNGTTLSLYDYVSDSYASADAGITEPSEEDYSIPTYSYNMITGSDLSEDSFNELYTSCTNALYWLGESSWGSYSMEEALDTSWGDNTDALHTALKSFIDKYAGTADEDGYILVTDEIKAALKNINATEGEEAVDWQWLWFCYDKTQSGTTTDYEAYSAASDKYYEAKDRISIRETLQDAENAYAVRSLYCYKEGNLATISENVLNASLFGNAILYNTTDLVSGTVNLENVTSTDDVTELFSIDYGNQNYLVSTDDTTAVQLSEGAADTLYSAGENGLIGLYLVDSKVYVNEGGGTLSVGDVSNGTVGTFNIITDDAQVYRADSTAVYYTSGEYSNNGSIYCDLYSYSGGKSTRLAQDIMIDGANLYGDNIILAYTGYRSDYGYELTMIGTDGSKTIIADDVTQYIRVDQNTLLYISGNDLYLYNGKEKTLVRSNVDWLWSLNRMEISYSFAGNNYDYEYDGDSY